MIRVRRYYRYSSDEQSDGWSIEAQDKASLTFIASRSDWTLDGKVYVDEAWSGKTVHRPDFQQMLEDARAGQFDVLVCHKLDRFSRSLVDVVLTLDELQKCGVTFASASEPIDFTTPMGRMLLFILAFFAEWYIQNLSAETTKGKHARFDSGYWNGDLRFGYNKFEAGEQLKAGKVKKLYKPVPNSDAQFVRLAYELCAAGHSDQFISDELNTAGSRTYRLIENCKKKADGTTDLKLRRVWTKDSVFVLFRPESAQFYLRNTPYIGEKERAKAKDLRQLKTNPNTHEPIISQELHERAIDARIKRRHPGRIYTTHLTKVYLLGERIAHCAWCGAPMRATSSKSGQQNSYYR